MPSAFVRSQVISRSEGRSVIACAAYRAGEDLQDEQQGKTYHYGKRHGVMAQGILTPTDAPDWMHDRQALWNAVERREDRSKRYAEAQLAREVVIALPYELDEQSREFLLKNILKDAATRKGMVADYAIHAPDKAGDNRNFHAHVLLTMRVIDPDDADGFGKKERAWNDRKELDAFKRIVERETNKMLARHGITERISFDVDAEQERSIHLGHSASELERRGIRTGAGEHNRSVAARNAARAALRQEQEELAALDRKQRRLDRHLTRLEAVELEQGQTASDTPTHYAPDDQTQQGTSQYAIDKLAELAEQQAQQGAGDDAAAQEAARRKAFDDAWQRHEDEQDQDHGYRI